MLFLDTLELSDIYHVLFIQMTQDIDFAHVLHEILKAILDEPLLCRYTD